MKKYNLKDIGKYEVLDEQSPSSSSSSPININDLEDGYDVIDDDVIDGNVSKNVSKVESLIRGFKQGATLGFADEIYGAGRAVIGNDLYNKAKDYLGKGIADYLVDTATTIGLPVAVGGRILNEIYSLATTDKKIEDIKEQFKKDYVKGRDEYREADKIAQEANPKTYIGGNIAGGVATSLIPVGGAVKGVGLVGRAALEGAVAGAGYSEGQNAKEVLQDAVVGGVVGSALGYGAHKLGQTITKNTAINQKAIQEGVKNNTPTKDLGAFVLGQEMIGHLIGGGVGVLGYRAAQKGFEKASPYLYPAVEKLQQNPQIAKFFEAALNRGISPQVAHYLYYNNVKNYREKVRNLLLGENDDKE